MASVDSRILTMKFDNKQFLSAVSATIAAMAKLKDSTSFSGAKKGIQDINAEAGKVNLNPLTRGAEGVSKAFVAMSTVAITALANITNKVVDAGLQFTKSLTLEPIMDGFKEYELNMNSIQTILANTRKDGTKLADVNGALDELNTYSDQTIYNFGQMAKNIGSATAAGVDLDTAVSYVKGFANSAAVAGVDATSMAGALEQMSQALAAGTIRAQDWISLEKRGLAGQVQQEAFYEMAKAMGTLNDVPLDQSFDEWTAAGNTLRGSLKDGWLTADVFLETMKVFGGEMDEAKLKALGFTGDTIDEMLELGEVGIDSATKIRTLTQLIDVVKESVASGWSVSFRNVFGDFEEATDLFTDVGNAVTGMVDKASSARNDILQGWNELGGRESLIQGLQNAFQALSGVLTPIKEAFRDIFPRKTAEDLFALTKGFEEFTAKLIPGEATMEKIKRVATGVFSVFSLGVKAVKAIANFFGDLFGAIFAGSGGFLDFAANIADFFTDLNAGVPKITLFEGVVGKVGDAVSTLGSAFGKLGEFIKPVLDQIGEFGSAVKERFQEVFQGIDWGSIFTLGGIGAAGGLALAIKKLIKEGIGIDLTGGVFDSVNDALEGLTGVLQGMQANLKANALLKIAGAIAILTASIVVLSFIDAGALTKSIAAIAAGFTVLLGAMGTLNKIVDSQGAIKMPALAASLILLAGAMLILSFAITRLSGLSWEEIGKGLVAVGGGLAILAGAAKILAASSKGMIRTGLGLIFVATALVIMSVAIKRMADLDWAELGKGLAAIAASLGVLAGAMKLMPNMALKSAGLIILGAALLIIARAVEAFAGPELLDSGKALLVMAGALGIIAAAVALIPPSVVVTAAGLLILAAALKIISGVLEDFGGMSIEEIAKGLITLAVSLGIIAVALYGMSGALAGAAALVVAAAAIRIFVPAIQALGSMSWGEIVKSLIALAGALTIIGVAAAVFGLAAPLLLIGGAALLVFGVGLAAVGVAALAFAKAFEIAVRAAGAGGAVIKAAFDAAIEAIPKAIKAFGQGVVEFIKVIGKSQKEFVKAFSAVIGAMLDAGIKNVPKMGKLFRSLLDEAIKTVRNYFPKLVKLGFEMIQKMLNGLSKNMPKIVDKGAEIITKLIRGIGNNIDDIVEEGVTAIVKFIRGVSNNLGRIIRAGANLAIRFIRGIQQNSNRIIDEGADAVIDFINGVARTIRARSGDLRTAGANLATAIISGMTGGLFSGVGRVITAAKNVASSALNAAKNFLGIKSPSKAFAEVGKYSDEGFADGLVKHTDKVKDGAEEVGKTAITTLRASMRSVGDSVSADIDMSPKITPVLDLSKVQKDAAGVGKAFDNVRLQPTVSIARASTISNDRAEALQVAAAQREAAEAANIQFIQHNTSPKALSAIEIYRNTRNQLSLAKEVLSP